MAHDGDRRMGHYLYLPADDECPNGAGCQHTTLPNGTEMRCRFCVVQGMLSKGEKYGWPLCPSCLCDEENIEGGCRFPNGTVPALQTAVASKLPPAEEACPAHRCFSHPEEIKNNLFRYADANACSHSPGYPGCIANTGCRMCVLSATQSTGTCPPCVCDEHDVLGCAVSDTRAENELDGVDYTVIRNTSTTVADISTLKGGYDFSFMQAHDACIREGYPGLCRRDSVVYFMSEVNTLVSRDMYFPTPADKQPRLDRVPIAKDPAALEMIGWTAEGTKGFWRSGASPLAETPGTGAWVQDSWLVNGNAWCCKSSVPHSHALAATVDTGMIEFTSSLAAVMSERLTSGDAQFTFDIGTVIPPNRSCSVELDLSTLKVIYNSQAPGAGDGESAACGAGEEAKQGLWLTTPDMVEHEVLDADKFTVFRDLTVGGGLYYLVVERGQLTHGGRLIDRDGLVSKFLPLSNCWDNSCVATSREASSLTPPRTTLSGTATSRPCSFRFQQSTTTTCCCTSGSRRVTCTGGRGWTTTRWRSERECTGRERFI